MPYQDRPLPSDFDVPAIVPLKPKRLPGRPKGATAKVTRDLKEGIIQSAINIGSDGNGEGGLIGFLEDLGRHHKRAFAGLLVKILPMQVNNTGTGASPTVINIVGVESGTFINAEGEQYRPPEDEPLQIEQLPEPAPPVSALEAKLLELSPQELLALAKAIGMSEEPDPDVGWNTRRR